MKMIRGERLDEWLLTHHGLSERLRIFVRIGEPIAFAHTRGVIHGDLKPANIMVGEFGEILVLDWGTPGAATPQFMAPEQGATRQPDARADVFAMGRILGILLETGILPGRQWAIPAPLRSIGRKATHTDPASRYAGIDELAADVTACMDHLPVQAHPESLSERVSRLFVKHRILMGLVLAYLRCGFF